MKTAIKREKLKPAVIPVDMALFICVAGCIFI